MDISVPEGLPAHASGPFAELAGQEPLSDQTRRLGLAPGSDPTPAAEAQPAAARCPNSKALERDAAEIAELVLPSPSPSPAPKLAAKRTRYPPETADEEEAPGEGAEEGAEEGASEDLSAYPRHTLEPKPEGEKYNASALGVSEVFAHLVRHLKHAASDYQESLRPFASTTNLAILEDNALRSYAF